MTNCYLLNWLRQPTQVVRVAFFITFPTLSVELLFKDYLKAANVNSYLHRNFQVRIHALSPVFSPVAVKMKLKMLTAHSSIQLGHCSIQLKNGAEISQRSG